MNFRFTIFTMFIAIFVWHFSAYAKDNDCISELPTFINARSNHSNDLLSVTCSATPSEFFRLVKPNLSIDYSKLKQIQCEFEQVLFRHAATPEGITEELFDAEQQLKSEGKTWKNLCENGLWISMKIHSIRDGVGEDRLKEPVKAFEQACESGAAEDVKASIRNLQLLETETCSVTTKSWTSNFTRINSKKWLNQVPPSGPCNLVQVEALECNENKNWVYRNTRVDADKGEFCDYLHASLNKPMISSPEIPKPLQLRCSFFK